MAPVHYHEGRFPPGERQEWEEPGPLIGPASPVARHDGMLSALGNRPFADHGGVEVVDPDAACPIPMERRAWRPSPAIA